jgi:hypothetical protein
MSFTTFVIHYDFYIIMDQIHLSSLVDQIQLVLGHISNRLHDLWEAIMIPCSGVSRNLESQGSRNGVDKRVLQQFHVTFQFTWMGEK